MKAETLSAPGRGGHRLCHLHAGSKRASSRVGTRGPQRFQRLIPTNEDRRAKHFFCFFIRDVDPKHRGLPARAPRDRRPGKGKFENEGWRRSPRRNTLSGGACDYRSHPQTPTAPSLAANAKGFTRDLAERKARRERKRCGATRKQFGFSSRGP